MNRRTSGGSSDVCHCACQQLFKNLQTIRNSISLKDQPTIQNKNKRARVAVRYLPHKAAHRISELNLFLYLRISGVSLCGLVLVGFTLTTEPFRVGSCLMASGLIPSQENPTKTQVHLKLFSVHTNNMAASLLTTLRKYSCVITESLSTQIKTCRR